MGPLGIFCVLPAGCGSLSSKCGKQSHVTFRVQWGTRKIDLNFTFNCNHFLSISIDVGLLWKASWYLFIFLGVHYGHFLGA